MSEILIVFSVENMAFEEDSIFFGLNNTTQFMQYMQPAQPTQPTQSTQSRQPISIPTHDSALVMSTRSTELDARHQQLLERRIRALENQLASIEPAEETKATAVAPEAHAKTAKDTKMAKDKQSSGDITQMPDEKVEIGYTVGSKSHGRKKIMIFDPLKVSWRQETPKVEDYATTKVKNDSDPETQCAFMFTEYYKEQSGDRAYDHSGIEVFSKELIGKLKETLGELGGIWDDKKESLRSPYRYIVYSWEKLVEQTVVSEEPHIPGSGSESERARETREALADLLECIRSTRELKEYFKTRDANIARQVTSFKDLWTFFPPATRVVASPFMGTRQLCLVEALKGRSDRESGKTYWQIECIYLDFDTSFSRRMISFKVMDFEDTKPLKALECYPTKFMDNEEEFLKLCEKQGKMFKTFCFGLKGAAKLFSYHGNAASSGIGLNKPQRMYPSVKGQVIVDWEAWNRWGPGDDIPSMGDTVAVPVDANAWLTSRIRKQGLHSIAERGFEDRCKDGDLLNEEYALLPPRLLGYVPAKRIFAQFAVKHLSPVEERDKDQVWNSDLILNEDKKKMIRTLVQNHAQMAHKRVPELVEGKGNGLVILLHGPPGVGKSLTAECVAKATSKPLLTVGVADIGTDSKTVEDNLNKLFSLAAEWDAVLVIDKADVFIEQGGSTDSTLELNALVSVLLRVIEYYEGILILTTNRVLSFNVAIQSRIHLAVMFRDLDENQTRSIIEVHLAKQIHNLSVAELDVFAQLAAEAVLNGRQIRNVISSAEAMVNGRKSKQITWDDIKSVLNQTKEFQQSLQ
ncbi:MAG: hypothetical protein Q9206_002032 [Seirophora lacunosa]